MIWNNANMKTYLYSCLITFRPLYLNMLKIKWPLLLFGLLMLLLQQIISAFANGKKYFSPATSKFRLYHRINQSINLYCAGSINWHSEQILIIDCRRWKFDKGSLPLSKVLSALTLHAISSANLSKLSRCLNNLIAVLRRLQHLFQHRQFLL